MTRAMSCDTLPLCWGWGVGGGRWRCVRACVCACVGCACRCVYVCMYVCMYVCHNVCMYVCMCLCVCMYVCMCICICMYVCMYTYVCINMYTVLPRFTAPLYNTTPAYRHRLIQYNSISVYFCDMLFYRKHSVAWCFLNNQPTWACLVTCIHYILDFGVVKSKLN